MSHLCQDHVSRVLGLHRTVEVVAGHAEALGACRTALGLGGSDAHWVCRVQLGQQARQDRPEVKGDSREDQDPQAELLASSDDPEGEKSENQEIKSLSSLCQCKHSHFDLLHELCPKLLVLLAHDGAFWITRSPSLRCRHDAP